MRETVSNDVSAALHYHWRWRYQSELPRVHGMDLADLLCECDWSRTLVDFPNWKETSAESQRVVVSLLDKMSLANAFANFVLPTESVRRQLGI